MSDPTSLFTNTGSGNTPPADQNSSNNDPLATLLSEIKNERGEPKYKDVSSALIGLKNAQEFIPSLQTKLTDTETELARLRTEAARVAELERVIESLTNAAPTTPSAPTAKTNEPSTVDLAATVEAVLTKREAKRKSDENTQQVVAAVQKAFGAEAESTFYAKASEVGMSKDEINALAAKSPVAVYKLLGLQATEAQSTPNTSPTNSSVNTSGFTPKPESFVTRNKKSIMLGATTQDQKIESDNARKMVDELHGQGLSIQDLTNPKVFFKHFG